MYKKLIGVLLYGLFITSSEASWKNWSSLPNCVSRLFCYKIPQGCAAIPQVQKHRSHQGKQYNAGYKSHYLSRIIASVGMFGALYADAQNQQQCQFFSLSRPAAIQYESDEAFARNKHIGPSRWGYNGDCASYNLLGINDNKLLKHIVDQQKDGSDVYILDVGSSLGHWGKNAFHILQKETDKRNIRVHIFSLTGGQECAECIKQGGNVTLYQFNQVKIENIDEELTKRGFDLKNKANLVVSRWTLYHLIDPFGTLSRIHSLLSPDKGFLLSDGFAFFYDNEEALQQFPSSNTSKFLNSSSTIIVKQNNTPPNSSDNSGEFLLVRTNEEQLRLPLEYTGKIRRIFTEHDRLNRKATVFKRSPLASNMDTSKQHFFRSWLWLSPYYCDKDNEQSKKLYEYLLKNKLFA